MIAKKQEVDKFHSLLNNRDGHLHPLSLIGIWGGYGVGPMQSTEFQYYFCTQGLLMILEVLFAALNRGFKDFCNVKN